MGLMNPINHINSHFWNMYFYVEIQYLKELFVFT